MKQSRSDAEPDGLSEKVAGLLGLGPERLKERWQTLYGTEPPPRISEDLLRRAVAHRLQERALGGLKPATRRLSTTLTAEALTRRIELPLSWCSQRTALNVE